MSEIEVKLKRLRPIKGEYIKDYLDNLDVYKNLSSSHEFQNQTNVGQGGINLESMLETAKKQLSFVYDNLTDNSKSFGAKMDSILSLQMLALQPIIQNLDETLYDERKAHSASRLNGMITHLKDSLIQKQQFELKEEIDLLHPKIQKAFSFLVESFIYVLTEVGVDASTKAMIVNSLSLKIMGFEEEMNNRLKGLSFSMLDNLENPILEGLPNIKQLELINQQKNTVKPIDKDDDEDIETVEDISNNINQQEQYKKVNLDNLNIDEDKKKAILEKIKQRKGE